MLVSELLDMVKVKIARFEPCIRGEDFVLRRYELKDVFALRPLFNPELFLSANGLERRAFGSFFSFFRWMVTTFQVFYVCEIEVHRGGRVVGFVGIYNLEIGRSLYLAIAVFNPEDRGRGYGSRAVGLLLNYLNKHRVAEKVYVEKEEWESAKQEEIHSLLLYYAQKHGKGYSLTGEESGGADTKRIKY